VSACSISRRSPMRRRLTPKISAASWAFTAYPLERPYPQVDPDRPGLGTTRCSRPGRPLERAVLPIRTLSQNPVGQCIRVTGLAQ
jgi:hypothetical protein